MATEGKTSLEHSTSSIAPTIQTNGPAEEEHQYPSMSRTWIVMLSIYMTMFLVALDKTILATAIPKITDEFNSLSAIAWYGSAFMLTLCAFQLMWGRIYTFYSVKHVFIAAIIVFEIGSAVCGSAPSSPALIVGRAISGLGAAGISNGAIIVVIETVPLDKRPMFQGLIGAVFGIASVVGPLLGGVFTEHASWRWCFYINLPFGAVVVAVQLFILRLPAKKRVERLTLWQQLKKLDLIGTGLLLPATVCLILALQWGGTTYAWSSWRVILLLVLFAVTAAGFIAVQILMPATATVPVRILKQRTIAASALYGFVSQASMLVTSYFIPVFFQALKNFTPTKAGEATLPFMLSLVLGSIIAGGLVQRIGYPAPFMIAATVLGSIGAGLISTWPIDVRSPMWIGYQFLYGFGIGLGMQQPMTNAQIVLPKEDQRTGVSLMFFVQNFGGAIFLSVGQSVFTDSLAEQLTEIPGLDLTRSQIVEMGATTIRGLVPDELLGVLLGGYHIAIRNTFYVGLTLTSLGLVGSVLVEWRSVKEGKKTRTVEENVKDNEEKVDV